MSIETGRARSVDSLSASAGREFVSRYFTRQPVVIRDALETWPARTWTLDHLKVHYGDLSIVAARYDARARETFLAQSLADVHRRMSLRQFLATIEQGESEYALREDTVIFERAPSLLEELAHFWPFIAAGRAVAYKALWIGPKNYITGLHLDPGDTLLFQVYGRKHILLYNPRQTTYLYEETDSGITQWFAKSALRERLDPAAFGVLQGKVRWCKVQPFDPDLVRFPLFSHAECILAQLDPGETLYIPDGWWHAVKGIDTTVSVSIEPDFRNSLFARTV